MNISKNKSNLMEELNLIKIKIDGININGEGVSSFNNKKVCVKNVLPNEEILANIKLEKSNFILASKEKVIKQSLLRVDAPCPYYEKCGGCDFQFVQDGDALKIKKEIIKDYLSCFYNGQLEAHPSPKCSYYRNKTSFFVDRNKIGLLEEGTNKIVEINSCLISSLQINNVLKVIKTFLVSNQTNFVSHIVVRELDNKFILTIVSKIDISSSKKFALKLVDCLKDNFENENFGVYINLNKSKNQILSDNWHHVYGLEYLTATVLNTKFCVHPYSFLQVNFEVMEKLYLDVLKNINDEVVIEGYSGAGLLSCIMAKKAKKVISVEINKSATQSANKTKQINNIKNLENINADCKNTLPKLAEKYPSSTFVIDPARSGCDKDILQALNNSNIKKIIYISCNPYTLKQNLGVLSQKYQVKDVQIFDMFPKTTHIETLVILEKI